MSAADVLRAAAERIDGQSAFVNERQFRTGAGPATYSAIHAAGEQMYTWTAVEILRRSLGIRQVQFWEETDPAKVSAALRAAAGNADGPDDEIAAARAHLFGFHTQLAEAVGWGPWAGMHSPDALVAEVVDRIDDLEKQLVHVGTLLDEEKRRAGVSLSPLADALGCEYRPDDLHRMRADIATRDVDPGDPWDRLDIAIAAALGSATKED